MITSLTVSKDNVSLRILELEDCVQTYVDWLNDIEVNQFLETRWHTHSIESIQKFVETIRESSHSYLFAIMYNKKHVGNIKIGPIHPIYKYGDISYFIGEKSLWGGGRNIATKSVALLTHFAFTELKLNRCQSSVLQDNIASQKVLENNGYIQEGVLRKKFFLINQDTYQNQIIYGLLQDEYNK